MRLEALSLEAFGPFRGRELDLVGEAETPFCVVYGPNEAGKSSALRAIRGLIYGIEHDSRDNFVHAHADLRIGARVRFADGLVARLLRRKGRKQTLSGEGEAGDEAVQRLEALVQAIPETLFRHFYGLDHPSLVEGSQQLLEDGGELSRALFGAGLGIVHLRKVMEGLESEAQALFVPRGQKQRIALALAEWREIQAEIRAQALEPSRFEAQARRVEELEQGLAALEAELAELQTSLSRARRIREARLAMVQAEQEREQVCARIAREGERAVALALSPRLLEAREPIEALHQQLEAYRRTRDELPRRLQRRAELSELIATLEEQLGGELGAASAADLRRIIARVEPIRARVAEVERCTARVEKSAEAEAEAQAELERIARHDAAASGAARLGAAGGPRSAEPGERREGPETHAEETLGGALALALDRARRLGPIDDEIAEGRRELAALDRSAAPRRAKLGLGDLASEAIESLAVPARSLIEAHFRRFEELAKEQQRARAAADARVLQRAALRAELDRLQAQGALPSESELRDVRAERDALWRRLRAAWREGDDGGALAERVEARIEAADRLADRLRSEAERVAQAGSLTLQLGRLDEETGAAERAAERLEAERAGLETEWRALWPAVIGEPGPPEARLEWRSALAELVALFEQRRSLADKLARRVEGRKVAVEAIRAALGGADRRNGSVERDDALGPWLERAEREQARRVEVDQRRRETARLREQAERQRERVERDRRQARAQLERAQAEWQQERDAVGLPPSLRLEEVARCLDRIVLLLERRGEAEQLERRILQMRAQVRRFEEDTARLVAACLPAIAEFAPDVAALRLKRQLEQAQEQSTLAEAIRSALADARQDLAEVERRLASRTEALAALVATGGEASTPDLDRLAARIAQLEDRLADRQEERVARVKSLSVERAGLQAMDGNARIAELAEQAESRLAAVRSDVVRYAELRLARQVLEQEVETFRRENQGPLLACASRIFASLTGGTYPSVLSDAGDDGRARLVAVHRTGRELAVEALSAGTRDQLFLALRLAALTTSQGHSEPMPLVADDILIEFDDERTRATLGVLAEVSRQTQVLLFSHHRHVPELARTLGEAVRIVEL